MRRNSPDLLNAVHIASGDLYAGAEAQLYQLVRQLHCSSQCAVSVILMNPGILEQRLRRLGVDVHVLDESRLGGIRIFLETWKLLRRIRPDIVHTHRRKENVIGGVAARFAGCGAIVQTVHGLPEDRGQPQSFAKRVYAWLDQLSARLLAAAVVAVSEELGPHLESLPQSKIVVIENGIDLEELEHSGVQVQLPPDQGFCTRVALVGRLVPVKRVDLFLEVARELLGRFPGRFCFFIFGDGPLAQELRSLCDRLGLGRDVNFMGFTENLASWLTLMDLVVITSDHEGLPLTLLEAMVVGVPVVAHAVGGIPEVLGNGEFGILVERQDAAEYASAIAAALDDRQALRTRSERAQQRVERRYTAGACADRYLALYRALAGA